MNLLPAALLPKIAREINVEYSARRKKKHDIDIEENDLSKILVETIRDVLSMPWEYNEGIPVGDGIYLSVQVYKATGPLEQMHGDIAIVVVDNDRGMAGTGFYEAKLQSLDGGYPTFKMQQMKRLESSTPRLAVVLHDRRGNPVCDDPFEWALSEDRQPDRNTTLSLCRVISASWVRKFKRLDHAVSELRPWSIGFHFVTRYLLGPDLDYSRPPVDAISRWVRTTRRGCPPVVIEIEISRYPEGHLRREVAFIEPASSRALLSPMIENGGLELIERLPFGK
jgi:hypothetical protein